jgi:hypothetical protein
MMSPGVTWTFLSIPHVVALVGDSCTMWALEDREVWKFESHEIGRKQAGRLLTPEAPKSEVKLRSSKLR